MSLSNEILTLWTHTFLVESKRYSSVSADEEVVISKVPAFEVLYWLWGQSPTGPCHSGLRHWNLTLVYQTVPDLAEWDGPRRPGSPTPRAFLSWLWKDTLLDKHHSVSNVTREADNITLRCSINDNALVNLRWAPIRRAERASMKQGDFQWLPQIETFI